MAAKIFTNPVITERFRSWDYAKNLKKPLLVQKVKNVVETVVPQQESVSKEFE